jgi:hypothetical protein
MGLRECFSPHEEEGKLEGRQHGRVRRLDKEFFSEWERIVYWPSNIMHGCMNSNLFQVT